MGRKGLGVGTVGARLIAPYLRVLMFSAVVLSVFGFIGYRSVRGQVAERLLDAGEVLMDYNGPGHRSGAQLMHVNGQEIHFSSGSTDRQVDDVLDYFYEVCAQHDGTLMEQMREGAPRLLDQGISPVFREGNGHRGVVACLDLGEGEVSASDIVDRVYAYRASNDLHDLGDIRYVFAQETSTGGTHFVSFWTNGSFNMAEALPEDGDAGGSDPTHFDRPPGARRTLVASQEGQDSVVVQYDGSTMTEWELEAFYTEQFRSQGWEIVPHTGPATDYQVVAARQMGREVYVALDTDGRGRGQATLVLAQ